MNTEIAARVIGIELPTELRLVKTAFRRLVMFAHPDVGGDAERFREIEAAYRCLSDAPEIFKEVTKDTPKQTVNGISLEELGKGYPLTVSAKACEDCEGRGYSLTRVGAQMKTCSACRGGGDLILKCGKCDGSGIFKINGRPKGKCFQCNGSGEFIPADEWRRRNIRTIWDQMRKRPPPSMLCPTCKGSGRVPDEQFGTMAALICDVCKGIGELKMFNPVLPRGLLA